ncbi:MAG: hypothetical protein PVJ98_00285 [Akkermansiaceae bacterium]|jgi:hypothetical protein
MNDLIDAGDPRTKVVGRRRGQLTGEAALRASLSLAKTALEIRKTPLKSPRGVFLFKSHEEADQWTKKNLLR